MKQIIWKRNTGVHKTIEAPFGLGILPTGNSTFKPCLGHSPSQTQWASCGRSCAPRVVSIAPPKLESVGCAGKTTILNSWCCPNAKTCKDMNFSGTFPSAMWWTERGGVKSTGSQQATRALSWVHSLIHPVQAGSEARKWINSWTRVRQLTKRLGGKQVYWVFSSDGNSEISHLLKLRNLPKVLPRQHLEPQKHEAYVRNFNHLPNDFPKFAYKHWHSITNFYLLHTIYIQVNDLWDASTEPLNNSCFLESWRSYLWYALGKSSGHAFGSGSEKLYTVVRVQ